MLAAAARRRVFPGVVGEISLSPTIRITDVILLTTVEKALNKGAKGNESDPEFFEGRQDLLRASPPQRVFALNRVTSDQPRLLRRTFQSL